MNSLFIVGNAGFISSTTQNPGRIQKVDQLRGSYKVPFSSQGIYCLDPPGGLGMYLLEGPK